MKRILAFSGSMSDLSINHQLIQYAAARLKNFEVTVIRLQEFEAPIYTKEREMKNGIPEPVLKLRGLFDQTDGFLISTPEYNGSVPAGFKNTLDWLSRMDGTIFQEKPVLQMAASPGGRGGKSVLDHLSSIIPFWGAKLIGTFSLPRFNDNFQKGKLNEPFASDLKQLTDQFRAAVPSS